MSISCDRCGVKQDSKQTAYPKYPRANATNKEYAAYDKAVQKVSELQFKRISTAVQNPNVLNVKSPMMVDICPKCMLDYNKHVKSFFEKEVV